MKTGTMTLSRTRSAGEILAFFPIFVDLRDRHCLVAGAGKVAAAKIDGLLHHGALVEVVSPRAVRQITEKARAGTIVWHKRRFAPQDLLGKFLVIAATGSVAVNSTIFRACAARNILCNSVDQPEHCHFFYPAVVRRGPLQIAISTGGCSPTLAARLRRELEQQFGPEWGAWVARLGELREGILAQPTTPVTRRRRLQRITTPEAFRAFLEADDPPTGTAAGGMRDQLGPRPMRRRSSLSATPTR